MTMSNDKMFGFLEFSKLVLEPFDKSSLSLSAVGVVVVSGPRKCSENRCWEFLLQFPFQER